MVDCGGLENRYAERHRGFESYPLRHYLTLGGRVGFEESFAPTNGRKSAFLARQQSGCPTRSELPKERAEGGESYPLRHYLILLRQHFTFKVRRFDPL